MNLNDAMLTIVHQANRERMVTGTLEQALEQANQQITRFNTETVRLAALVTDRDAEVAALKSALQSVTGALAVDTDGGAPD
jgi:N-acetylglucosamine kinase-like BadF-type ATPase